MKKYPLILLLLVSNICLAQFTRITSQPPVTDGLNSHGASWVDYDDDGDDDIFVAVNPSPESPSSKDALYQNNGDGTFTAITTSAIVTQDGTGRNSTWADYDNDGLPDVFITDQIETFLYKNDGGGNFTKITAIPTTTISFDSDHQGGAWGDYNGDGFLDLFVASYKLNDNARNVLYTNNGDGTFMQSSDTDIVTTQGYGQDPSWIDYDQNGTLDLFVPNYGGTPNFLYSNLGDGTFGAITDQPLVTTSHASVGASWADYDNDGDFDLFASTNVNASNYFFENNSNGTFTLKNGMFGSTLSSTASWADFDNDGFIDLMMAGGVGDKTRLFRNNGDKTFTDVSVAQGINNTNYSWAVAAADYDKDGFIDFFIANEHGNNHSADDILYHNTPNSNHWISIKLVGTNTNRNAIGTVVRVHSGTKWQTRTVQSKTGSNAQNSQRVHFGLGQASAIDRIVVEWPGKGFQELASQAADEFITITEISFPDPPGELTTSNEAYGMVELSWTDNSSDETGFRIERSTGNGAFVKIGEVSANITSFTDNTATPGETHVYRVAAMTTGGYSLFPVANTIYSKASQQVTTFEDIGQKYLMSPPFQLHAEMSSGLEPSFVILEGEEFVSLEGDILTILELGTSVIGAYAGGNDAFFSSDTVTQTLVVDLVTALADHPSGSLSVYPNPVGDELYIRHGSDASYPMTILNSAGMVVHSVSSVSGDESVSLKGLAPGFYILDIGNRRVKMIKK